MKPTHIFVLVIGLAVLVGGQLMASSELPKAFQQQAQADLVVEFWHWESLSIIKPDQGEPDHGEHTKAQFLAMLEKKKIGRALVVVVLDKREAPEGKVVSPDDLVADFHRLGFRRVIVQLAVSDMHPDGLRILKDSENPEANQTPHPTPL